MITLTCTVSFLQTLTSVPAALTTATVHLLHVQTQWDPLVVHVTVLPAEMAELAIYHQVIIRQILSEDVHSLNPYLHSLEAHYPGGGGLSKFLLGMCRWLLRASTPLPYIVYSVTNYRTYPSHFWAKKYVIFSIPSQSLSIFMN